MDEKSEFEVTQEEFRRFREHMRDPLVLGALMHKLSEERASSNLVLKEINAKLDRLLSLEERLIQMETRMSRAPTEEAPLAEIDEDIVKFVARKKRVCADQVQKQFGYRGSNAASSRLNRMVREGRLKKMQVGRKVFFMTLH
ncbi:hypothetical protein KJ765_03645 [Candidatus Micrarchaeota archaeon]|nr:hypothetical protein [Candidatus Micrarchaeota archaeon]